MGRKGLERQFYLPLLELFFFAMLLRGVNVTKRFGGLVALNKINFHINKGEILGLIGPNGSGKTTLFNVISGFYKPDEGEVYFKGHKISGLPPHKICKLGIARTFQIVRPFMEMKVLDNVAIAMVHGGQGRSLREARTEALRLLKIVGLREKAEKRARALTLAERKRLEIARALATSPDLILMDEFVAGLNPVETEGAIGLIKQIHDDLGVTVFWIEHVMKAIMRVCERIMVLHHGNKIAEGTPQEIACNEEVVKAYLGERLARGQ